MSATQLRIAAPSPSRSRRNLLGDRFGSNVPTHEWHRSVVERYGDVVHLRRFGPVHYYVVSHPADIERVLRTNHSNYRKPRLLTKRFSLLLGDGLFTADGSHWLQQRRLIQPAFHRRRVESFASVMTGAAVETANTWDKYARDHVSLDVPEEMMPLTLRVVTRSLLGSDPGGHVDSFISAFGTAMEFLNRRLHAKVSAPLWVPTSSHRRFRDARAELDRHLYAIIAARKRGGTAGDDLLGMLLDARDAETGDLMSHRQLRDEVATIMLAGHETTAVGLSWVWYALSQYPEVEHKLHAELDRELGGRVPVAEDLPRLQYTRAIIDEALRLYPPAWVLIRQAIGEDELGGYRIPPGALITMYSYITHRRAHWWKEPDRFNPEHFMPQSSADRPQFAYFPFGGGPRQCIGAGFALMEMQLVLATLAQRFRLRLVPGHPVEAQPTVTLRPRFGLRMAVHPRPCL